tara:strand:- start:283 stop:390 length:108 start_codon:yes stop_codon:yes gene_type:complete
MVQLHLIVQIVGGVVCTSKMRDTLDLMMFVVGQIQ